MNQRHSVWTLLSGMLLGFPIFYVGSLGFILWLDEWNCLPIWSVTPLTVLYWPLLWLGENGPEPIQSALDAYAEFCRHGV